MDFELHYRDGIFEVVTHGDAEVVKFREYLDRTASHEHWSPGAPVLHDHSDLNSGPLTVGDVARIADYCAASRNDFGRSKVAVVLSRDLEYGLARMWGALVDGKWDAIPNLFRSRDEAVLWLKGTP